MYGRETDRPARLEVIGVVAADVPALKSALADVAGPLLGTPCKEETMDRVSATRKMLDPTWLVPKDATVEQYRRLVSDDERDVLMNRWPKMPLGVLGGKTPQEAAGDPPLRARVLGAVLVLQAWSDPTGDGFDFNQLRAQLGLPTLEPIDPEVSKADEVPATRLIRLVVEKLSDEALATCYHRAVGLNAPAAIRKFAEAIVGRPGFEKRPERLRAFSALARLAQDSGLALEYVDRGRNAAEAEGQSSASFDLLELSIRFRRREGPEVGRLLRHIESQHLREPGVANALQQMLVQFGLLRPDGTPVEFPSREAPQEPVAEPTGQADEPGKLWLPDSQRPTGEKPRIWTPGMD